MAAATIGLEVRTTPAAAGLEVSARKAGPEDRTARRNIRMAVEDFLRMRLFANYLLPPAKRG